MGTWDRGHFDNDDAADLLADMGPAFSPDIADAALGACLIPAEGYLEAPEGQRGIAAAALVRLLLSDDGAADDGTAEAGDHRIVFDRMQVDPRRIHDLRRAATAALNRILAGKSEIIELWEESPEFSDWVLGVGCLRDELAKGG